MLAFESFWLAELTRYNGKLSVNKLIPQLF